jgi:hypothetical protein
MKNFFLSLALLYGIGMTAYGTMWYFKDMNMLEIAVRTNNSKVEMRHRINTWGNVGTILMANLIATVAIAGMNTSNNKDKTS